MIDLDSTIAEAIRQRIILLAAHGTIKVVDDSGAVQQLQVQVSKNETYDGNMRLAEFGFTSNPPAGSDSLVIFLGGNRSNGVVVATNNQSIRIKNLAGGEVAVYDAFGKSIQLKSNGIVINANNQSVAVNNASILTVDGPTKVVGNVSVSTGATGTFGTSTGQTVFVQDGIVTNIY